MTQPPTPPTGPDQPGGYPSAAPQPPADPAGFAAPSPASGPPAPPPGGYAPPAGGYAPGAEGYAPGAEGHAAPPAGYSAPPPPAARPGAGFDPSTVAKSDWAFFGIGFLMLIFSFFGWVSASSSFGISESAGGWNRWWILIQLLLVASIAVRAIQVFTGNLKKEIPGVAQVGVAAVMVVLYLIALIQTFAESESVDEGPYSYSVGPGFGIWASLILSLGFVYFLALSKQKEGPLPLTVPGPANF